MFYLLPLLWFEICFDFPSSLPQTLCDRTDLSSGWFGVGIAESTIRWWGFLSNLWELRSKITLILNCFGYVIVEFEFFVMKLVRICDDFVWICVESKLIWARVHDFGDEFLGFFAFLIVTVKREKMEFCFCVFDVLASCVWICWHLCSECAFYRLPCGCEEDFLLRLGWVLMITNSHHKSRKTIWRLKLKNEDNGT